MCVFDGGTKIAVKYRLKDVIVFLLQFSQVKVVSETHHEPVTTNEDVICYIKRRYCKII